jgi:hypothetical protein
MDSLLECPICMDSIDQISNKVITECGHTFHCSCLMKNAVHNGFGCPYCRTTMAEEPEFSDEDEDEQYEEFTEESDNENHNEEDPNPPIDYIIEKLKEQQTSYDALVRAYCFDELDITNEEDDKKCIESYNDVYKSISDIIFDYRRDMIEIAYNETPPDIAESKYKNENTIQSQYSECY